MMAIATIIAFAVLFIHYTMQEEEIFGFVQVWLAPLINKIKKPLIGCPICMTPWWGSLIIWIGILCNAWIPPTVFEWLMILAIAGGINTVLTKI
jgi:hypothetical protein